VASELSTLSTDELLRRAASSRDSAGFGAVAGELIGRYRRLVYAHALAICSNDRGMADDVFQETFLRLMRWLARNRGMPLHSLPRLLKVFSRRAAIDLLRKEGRPAVSTVEQKTVPDLDTVLYVQQLLEGLDHRSAEVLRLTYMAGHSATEIAERVGVKPDYVRLLRYRALEAIRARQAMDDAADEFEDL
jgi:RNA polymerase sigma factor (sigma-70 family)